MVLLMLEMMIGILYFQRYMQVEQVVWFMVKFIEFLFGFRFKVLSWLLVNCKVLVQLWFGLLVVEELGELGGVWIDIWLRFELVCLWFGMLGEVVMLLLLFWQLGLEVVFMMMLLLLCRFDFMVFFMVVVLVFLLLQIQRFLCLFILNRVLILQQLLSFFERIL